MRPLFVASHCKCLVPSAAIATGLGYPNCRHIPVTPRFSDVNEPESVSSAGENEIIHKNYVAEEKHRFMERHIRKSKHLAEGSVYLANSSRYSGEVKNG